MTASRKERRAARRRLTPSKIYTLSANGEAMEALARCLLIRPDGGIVSMHMQLDEDKGAELRPVMIVHDRLGGLRARLAYWLLRA